ncbi:ABC transporter permease [Natronoarchaeum sp. GCM10025703]|uniref:ABC transporter permease n=1 Tax=Natronoarchaeum sp. GCM10025703 TaxID=3252685 RepID=UPI0036243511
MATNRSSSAEEAGATSGAAEAVRGELNAREERIDVFELSEITDEIDEFFSLLQSFLLGIGSISLVIAGVSILNVMLMSTVERREEIGVMRAVGVKKGEVLRMMLIEAGLLGLVGAVGGVVVSILLAAGLYLGTTVGLDILLDPTNLFYLALAFTFGIAVSLLSGLYPAWKAASERPVDALRD